MVSPLIQLNHHLLILVIDVLMVSPLIQLNHHLLILDWLISPISICLGCQGSSSSFKNSMGFVQRSSMIKFVIFSSQLNRWGMSWGRRNKGGICPGPAHQLCLGRSWPSGCSWSGVNFFWIYFWRSAVQDFVFFVTGSFVLFQCAGI